MRTVLDSHVYVLKVRITDSFGEDTFAVKIEPAPKGDHTRGLGGFGAGRGLGLGVGNVVQPVVYDTVPSGEIATSSMVGSLP